MRLLGSLTEARVTDRLRYHEKVLLPAYTSQKKSYTTKQSQAPINIPLLQPARTCVFGAEKTEVSGVGLHSLSLLPPGSMNATSPETYPSATLFSFFTATTVG